MVIAAMTNPAPRSLELVLIIDMPQLTFPHTLQFVLTVIAAYL